MEKTAVLEKPKTHEEVARGKLTLTDPYSPPFPYWHSVKFEKLEDILKEGWIAGEFADHIGKKTYKSSEGRPISKKYVSLAHADPRIIPAPEIGILVNPSNQVVDPRKNPPEGTKPEDFKNVHHNEVLVARRIAPREFRGIVIGEYQGMDMSEGGYTFSSIAPLNLQHVVSLIKRLDPTRALPVYFRGELVWPS